ncbi:helix-turn-helix transcriptional regulator [Roseateles sp.]|uniref:helix-turn-helix domain-containing protein n=1 Tax=Roseateles sp. TaxID=1971397 RepID=UPI002F42257F
MPRKQHPPSALIADLRQARIDQGLTQTDVADALHVGRKQVSDWETGWAVPLVTSAQEWASVLGRRLTWEPIGVDVSALLGELDDEL